MVRLSVGLLLLVLWSVVARAALQEGIDPGAAAASDSKKKPLCFAEVSRDPVQLAQAPPTARQFSRLAGTWEQFSKPSQAQPDPTPFWNLSCPLEWSKYSCVHQGLEAHASAAASWRFVPRDCELPRLLRPGVLAAALGNRSVFIGGDSLARQLFVSLGCRLLHASKVFASPTSVHAEAEWGGPSKRHWSCGSTNNCIQDGPHSGFFSASVSLTTTTSQRANIVSLDLVNLVTNHEKLVSCQDAKGSRSGARAQCVIRKSHPIRVGDIVVLEGGVHGPANKSTPIISKWFRELTAVGAIPVWLPTWPPAFASIDGSGDYRPDYLFKRKAANGGQPVACVDTTRNGRASEEREILKAHGAEVVAVLELEGIENLGSAKVGAWLSGGLGDCQHYCLPGPPGAYAQALYALLLATAN